MSDDDELKTVAEIDISKLAISIVYGVFVLLVYIHSAAPIDGNVFFHAMIGGVVLTAGFVVCYVALDFTGKFTEQYVDDWEEKLYK